MVGDGEILRRARLACARLPRVDGRSRLRGRGRMVLEIRRITGLRVSVQQTYLWEKKGRICPYSREAVLRACAEIEKCAGGA